VERVGYDDDWMESTMERPTQLDLTAPLVLRGSSRFRLYWELETGGADALYDFVTGEVLEVHVSSLEDAATPDLRGGKLIGPDDPNRPNVWKWTLEGGARHIGAWAQVNARHLTVELFDRVVRAITDRLPALANAGVVWRDESVTVRTQAKLDEPT
jgi:hypothetical protein